MVKEEVDTSHLNQYYDQKVAKGDKEYMRLALVAVGSDLNNQMDQWYLIVISIKAQNKINKK